MIASKHLAADLRTYTVYNARMYAYCIRQGTTQVTMLGDSNYFSTSAWNVKKSLKSNQTMNEISGKVKVQKSTVQLSI